MQLKSAMLETAALLCLAVWQAQAQTAPNLSGNYRCEPQPDACKAGQTFTLAQSGNSIDLKNERGEQGHARLTSPSTISTGAPQHARRDSRRRHRLVEWHALAQAVARLVVPQFEFLARSRIDPDQAIGGLEGFLGPRRVARTC
jgi:hypothetical protein